MKDKRFHWLVYLYANRETSEILVLQKQRVDTYKHKIVDSFPTRGFGLWHCTEYMIEVLSSYIIRI